MPRETVDILISGGGIAGLTAAAAFGHAGYTVLLADPGPVPAAPGPDLRSTAFLRPARDLFQRIGIWQDLAPHAATLDGLRLVDAPGSPPVIAETRLFEPGDIGEETFGWNLPNAVIRSALLAFLGRQPGIELAWKTGYAALLQRTNAALVSLSDGRRIAARLVIGADGRGSAVREAAGIGVETARYGQKALAFSVSHPVPHDRISTEVYNRGGAFTTVPLPDIDGAPASAVIWMNDGPRALNLADMAQAPFNTAMTERSCGLLGPLALEGGRQVWPVITQRAQALTAGRVALVAEAAHVLPPIGAQGLNTSLHDIVALCDLIGDDPGAPAGLAGYSRQRGRDIALRARAIDLFNRICQSDQPPVQALRRVGLRTIHDVAPLRHAVMRAGLGQSRGRGHPA